MDPCHIGSMYGIFTYIYHKNGPTNVGKYIIHGYIETYWIHICINVYVNISNPRICHWVHSQLESRWGFFIRRVLGWMAFSCFFSCSFCGLPFSGKTQTLGFSFSGGVKCSTLNIYSFCSYNQWDFQGPPIMGPLHPYYSHNSHKNPERYGKLVWVPLTMNKGVPCPVGVPGKSPLI